MNPTVQEATVLPRNVVYPDSDGEPLGETDFHIGAIFYLRMALRLLFRKLADVYVAADMFIYYEEGEPTSRVAPDIFAVRGVAPHDRRCYMLWEEGVPPCLTIEVTSRSSRLDDLGNKRGLYEMLGVSEYVLFDPLGEYLDPRFRVFKLDQGIYRQANLESDGAYRSTVLPVVFKPERSMLRVVEPRTGNPVPLTEEAVDEAKAQKRRAEAQKRRAEAQKHRAEEEKHRAEEEKHRAEELETTLDRYREKYGDLGE